MSELDKYYQRLGLKPGASEEEIKEAYRDLVNVWHPDRFSDNQRLIEKANKEIKEIDIAYENLISCFAEETFTTSEGKSYDKSQPPPHEPPPHSTKEQDATTDVKNQGDLQPPPGQSPGQKPHEETRGGISSEKRIKTFFSWPNISFFICYGFGLLKSITKSGGFTAHSFGAGLGISFRLILCEMEVIKWKIVCMKRA